MNSREKAFNKISSKFSECVSHGVVTTKRPGVRKVPSSIPGRTCFFSFSFFFLFLYVQSSFQFLQFSFISLYGLCFFQIINFLPYCFSPFQLLAVLQSPSRDPAIHVFLVERFVSLSVPCFFQKVCFLLPICCRALAVGRICNRDKILCCDSARQTFASLGLFTFIRTACLLQL